MRVALAFAALALLIATPARADENRTWLEYGHDAQQTNAVDSTTLTPRAAPTLHVSWRAQLDGEVDASPLAAPVGGREIVFVSTEAGSVYALAAETGQVIWQRTSGNVTTPGGLRGTWGITSAGAIDPQRGLLYVIGADGWLHALALASGAEATGWPVQLVERTEYEYVWGALRIAGDRLYVPVASYCDQPDPQGVMAEGRLLAVTLDDPQSTSVLDTVPGYGNLGGIWGWGGISIDPGTGTLFTGVGNSYVYSAECACYVDDAGLGDRLIEVTPDLSSVLQSDNPGPLPTTGDYDFGAAPLLFRPRGCPPLAAANNKIGALFVWNRNHLERGPIVALQLSNGVSPFVGAPSYSASLRFLYENQVDLEYGGRSLGSGVEAFLVDSGCRLKAVWSAALGSGVQPEPLVVGDVLVAGGGFSGNFSVRDAITGVELWSFDTHGAATVSAIISADGSIFAGDGAGTFYAFSPAGRRRH